MKSLRLFIAACATLLAACSASAADSKPIARVISVLDIETDDPGAYATWIKQYNEVAKAKLNIDPYLRVYQSGFDGKGAGNVRAVISAASVAELMKNAASLENDPAILENQQHIKAVRKIGARVLYQAVRFDGVNPKGANNYTTLAIIPDEAAYLTAVDELRKVLDTAGLKDAKIGVYRVLAGRTDHTHRVTVSLPSRERLAVFLDSAATHAQLNAWLASTAKLRTVVANMTSREITK